MDDEQLFDQINALSKEEEELYARASSEGGLSDGERGRLHELKIRLDQTYDLLRQRQARRSAGLDPDEAELRPADVVESYEQ